MSNELYNQIRNELNLRETEDLLEIWHTNDHEEWSDAAFEVVKQILIERLGEIPPQKDFVDETQDEADPSENDGLDEWEAKLLDNENQPEFYDTLEVITLKANIDKTAKAVIIVYALGIFTSFQWFSSIVGSYFQNRVEFTLLIYFITFVVLGISTAVTIAITYFPLKALSNILRILMEMEFNSRKAD